MSENPTPAAGDALPVVRDPELDRLARLGKWLALAESKTDTPEAKGATAALRLYYAGELGLPPLAAAELSMIGGRLVVSARLLRALALRAGYRVIRVESSDEQCVAAVVVIATGEELGRATFTIEDAKRAGLIRDRSAWQSHPARMLWARASAFVVYDCCPDVALGLITEEETDELDPPADGRPAPAIHDAQWQDAEPQEAPAA